MKAKIILIILILAIFNSYNSFAQKTEATHKIIFQITSPDTLAHLQLTKQLNNILTVAPGTQLEVVCHGQGLNMLVAANSTVSKKIEELTKAGVVFNACEFSMKEKKIEKSQMLPTATFVPAGIIEIVTKQEQGWSYIKSGF